jgi:hypothetical protein
MASSIRILITDDSTQCERPSAPLLTQEATTKGRLAMSLTTPELFSEVADGVTGNGDGNCVSLIREPDAANPRVRFDERGVETEARRS